MNELKSVNTDAPLTREELAAFMIELNSRYDEHMKTLASGMTGFATRMNDLCDLVVRRCDEIEVGMMRQEKLIKDSVPGSVIKKAAASPKVITKSAELKTCPAAIKDKISVYADRHGIKMPRAYSVVYEKCSDLLGFDIRHAAQQYAKVFNCKECSPGYYIRYNTRAMEVFNTVVNE